VRELLFVGPLRGRSLRLSALRKKDAGTGVTPMRTGSLRLRPMCLVRTRREPPPDLRLRSSEIYSLS